MNIFVKLFVAVEGLFLFVLGILWTFNSRATNKNFDVMTLSSKGSNVVTSHVGGTFFIYVLFVVLYFVFKDDHWAASAAVATAAILIARVITVVSDGISTYSLIAMANEVAMIAALTYLVRRHPVT